MMLGSYLGNARYFQCKRLDSRANGSVMPNIVKKSDKGSNFLHLGSVQHPLQSERIDFERWAKQSSLNYATVNIFLKYHSTALEDSHTMLAHLTLSKGSFGSRSKVSIFRATVRPTTSLKSQNGMPQLRMYRQAPPKTLLSMFEAANARFVTRIQMRPIPSSNRLLHTSFSLQKKSTTTIRRERAASTPVPQDAVKSGVLFEKDRYVELLAYFLSFPPFSHLTQPLPIFTIV